VLQERGLLQEGAGEQDQHRVVAETKVETAGQEQPVVAVEEAAGQELQDAAGQEQPVLGESALLVPGGSSSCCVQRR
jgi:hypothetical protein